VSSWAQVLPVFGARSRRRRSLAARGEIEVPVSPSLDLETAAGLLPSIIFLALRAEFWLAFPTETQKHRGFLSRRGAERGERPRSLGWGCRAPPLFMQIYNYD